MSKTDNASAYDSGIYDSNIVNVLPYYTEFHAQVMDLVKTMGLNAPKWLDTGCGTGTLALRALSENNSIRFTLADPSAQMLEQARAKTGDKASYVNCGSHELSFENMFDVVTAIQSHHYYDKPGREQAVKHCYDALKECGFTSVNVLWQSYLQAGFWAIK